MNSPWVRHSDGTVRHMCPNLNVYSNMPIRAGAEDGYLVCKLCNKKVPVMLSDSNILFIWGEPAGRELLTKVFDTPLDISQYAKDIS